MTLSYYVKYLTLLVGLLENLQCALSWGSRFNGAFLP